MPEIDAASPVPPENDPLVRKWERLLKDQYRAAVNEAILRFPKDAAVEIPWDAVAAFDEDLATRLLDDPVQTLVAADQAIRTIDPPFGAKPDARPRIRPIQLPEGARVAIRDLRSAHLGKLVAVRGLVKRATQVRPRIADAVYTCARCGALIREAQAEHLVLREPIECYEDQGGCGRASNFKLVTEHHKARGPGAISQMVDTQKIELQELPDGLRGAEQTHRLVGWLEADLCAKMAAGDRVVVNGILRTHVTRVSGVKQSVLELYFDVLSIEMEEREYEEVDVSEEEEAAIRRLAQSDDVFDQLCRCIAPEILGYDREKGAILLQVFGGVPKITDSGTRQRGEIHILLVGDPGVAKTLILNSVRSIAPRCVFATGGKSSTGAGLTATAQKDAVFGEGRWTLEAGATVLADKGHLLLDEADKSDKGELENLYDPLELGRVTINKAGINTTLSARCTMLAAANPKHGRFDANQPIPDQLDFEPAFLSRFDLIFTLFDVPNASRDTEIADSILAIHSATAQLETSGPRTQKRAVAGALDSAFVRKYVAFAKRECHPRLSPPAAQHLRDYYVRMRSAASKTNSAIPVTPRQLPAMVRLAEASARVRLSPVVTLDDAQRAIEIVEASLRGINTSEGGILDADIAATGSSKAQRETAQRVKDAIRELTAGTDRGAFIDEIAAHLRGEVQAERVRTAVRHLLQRNDVYETSDEHYRLVR